jgi:phenylacetate-coenzyme A ligase PaaK-like adenylate-forming protein
MIQKISDPILREISVRRSQKYLQLSTAEMKVIQEKKLRKLIEHAYNTVPFYHKKFDDAGIKPGDIRNYSDLEKIPLVSKAELKNAGTSTISTQIGLKNCIPDRTGGSTGIPLTLYFTKKDIWATTFERIRRENGYNPGKDVALEITGNSFLPADRRWYHTLFFPAWYQLNISDPIPAQIAAIATVKPDIIWGYPSAIEIICNNLKMQGIDTVKPKIVFTASEVLSDHTRHSIENILDTTVFDVYGCHETGCVAWECSEHNGYHTCMDTCALEFLDKNNERIESGESGRVVVTNLHSFAMPIIRYEIGDSATPTGTSCSCGRGGYMIKSINGRNDDFIKLSGNRTVSPRVIGKIMHNYHESMMHYQLIQENETHFTFNFIVAPDIDSIIVIEKIGNDLKHLLGEDVNISVHSVDHIEREGSLKRRFVISRI